MAEAIEMGGREGNSVFFLCRVSDRREEGIATFAPGHWRTERCRSQDIVVSARGWLVVNPLGVTTPTVGWKRAPLSAVASIAEVFLISVFLIFPFEIYMLSHMFMDLWNCKCPCEGIVCTIIVNME
jgi:hypothetical protein